jgi:hypothetical protein
MPGSVTGTADFAALSKRLKEAGETGLRRELYKAIDKAAQDLKKEIAHPLHLYSYLPNPYADVLAADLKVSVYKRSGRDPHLTIRAEGRAHNRKIIQLDERGVLVHPVFARSSRRRDWTWRDQFSHVRQGFFTDPVEKAAPAVREKILAAMQETARKITRG